MPLKPKKKLSDEAGLARTIHRMASQFLEAFPDFKDVIVVGVHTRGVPIAKRIAKVLGTLGVKKVPLGALDITLYRDDLTTIAANPVVKPTQLDFSVDGKTVLLVDDVLFTGRTVRAALDAVMDWGRPAAIKLAVLVDRGHRELPVQADFVGKVVPTSPAESVEVRVKEIDGEDSIWIMEKGHGA
jgi:pyrimidine operon attenuation protein / uracil phosphoribosyltransferase